MSGAEGKKNTRGWRDSISLYRIKGAHLVKKFVFRSEVIRNFKKGVKGFYLWLLEECFLEKRW